ncbi:MAG: helix-turn-helix transcriptional regulator [Clostridia bacterium]|nr:helix-turn-helix transcriptional regulator [Clostridia bacterium]
MDQLKTGRFISQMRKEKGLTQRELAELLLISDKTVSKWECGNGLPEVSLMMPLCKILGITVNELLSGRRLSESEYQKNAEENMMKLIDEKREGKFRLIVEFCVVMLTLLAAITIIMVSSMFEMETWKRIVLIVVAIVVMFGGIAVAAALEMRNAVFECRACGERFVPTKTAYIMGAHTIMRRHLKCPHCGKFTWAKRCFSLEKDDE